MCLLDVDKLSRIEKWHLFGTESEAKTFGVVSLTWWEGRRPSSSSSSAQSQSNQELAEFQSDDLLVALIHSNNGRRYLSSWSPKR